jgi:hypothetical protein
MCSSKWPSNSGCGKPGYSVCKTGFVMDLVLVTITAISLFLAIALGLIVFKLLREERLRSEARVALLTSAVGERPVRTHREAAPQPASRVPPSVASGELFVVAEDESPWRQRFGAALAVGALMVLVGYGLTWIGSSSSSAARETAATEAPLELVSLQHAFEGGTFAISGTVLNPRHGAPVAQPSVTASLFAPDGSLLATQQSALDYATLAPGDESGFVIKIPMKGAVSRYRVGFRRPDGSVIAHVDRRTDGASVRNAADARSPSWPR